VNATNQIKFPKWFPEWCKIVTRLSYIKNHRRLLHSYSIVLRKFII